MGHILIVFFLLSVLTGCDELSDTLKKPDWEVKEVNHQTYLLNPKSGQLFVVDKGIALEVSRISEIELNHKHFKDNEISSINTTGSINIAYRSGSLNYSVDIVPEFITDVKSILNNNTSNSGSDKKSNFQIKNPDWAKSFEEGKPLSSLIFNFIDRDGIQIASDSVSTWRGRTSIINKNGEIAGYRFDGKIRIDPISYVAITNASIGWVTSEDKKPK